MPHLGAKNPKYKYHIKQGHAISELTETTCETALGVFVDPRLNVNKHNMSTTVTKQIGKKSRMMM